MESFTIELVSNTSAHFFPDNTLSSFTNFLPEQLNLDGQWEVAISEISYPSMYQSVTEGKFMFFDKKISKSSEFFYLEPGLYPSITEIVEAMIILIQERHNHSENCIKVKMSRKTQKVEIYQANEASGLTFFSTDLGHIFGSIVGNEFGVMLRGKGPHKPDFAHDIVRIHSLMIYTDVIEYKIVGDTKAPLLPCFLFISKLKSGDIITIGQYRKQLGEGSRRRTGGSKKRSASRVIPTKSAEQISRSRRDNFTNISHYSCRVIFGTNLLWQFLEILEGKSQ